MTAGLLLALGLIATFPSSANGSRVGNRSHSGVVPVIPVIPERVMLG